MRGFVATTMCMQDLGLSVPRQECRNTDGIYGAVIKQEVLADTVTDFGLRLQSVGQGTQALSPPRQIGRQ